MTAKLTVDYFDEYSMEMNKEKQSMLFMATVYGYLCGLKETLSFTDQIDRLTRIIQRTQTPPDL